mmetsp:Transcript_29897/g.58427  ORF Transcript_29897/g.58427 Transcript_29897/m.58427 type:complete len:228 (+) Transcript_29897:716-1399(+)
MKAAEGWKIHIPRQIRKSIFCCCCCGVPVGLQLLRGVLEDGLWTLGIVQLELHFARVVSSPELNLLELLDVDQPPAPLVDSLKLAAKTPQFLVGEGGGPPVLEALGVRLLAHLRHQLGRLPCRRNAPPNAVLLRPVLGDEGTDCLGEPVAASLPPLPLPLELLQVHDHTRRLPEPHPCALLRILNLSRGRKAHVEGIQVPVLLVRHPGRRVARVECVVGCHRCPPPE